MRLRDRRRAHRRCDADLRLAAAFGRRQRRVVLAQIADDGAGKQRLAQLLVGLLRAVRAERIDDRRHDPGRSAGRRGDDQVAARIFFRTGKRGRGNDADAAPGRQRLLHRVLVDVARLGLELDRPRQGRRRRREAGLHRRAHRADDLVEEGVDLRLARGRKSPVSLAMASCGERDVVALGVVRGPPPSSNRDISAGSSWAACSPSTR